MEGSLWFWLACGQGLYYTLTGVWPIVHFGSFMAVTGPKTDVWLVQLFGAMICVPGMALLRTAWLRRPNRGLFGVAAAFCGVLLAGDLIFVIQRRIGPVYLLDGAAEAGLLIGWAVVLTRHRGGSSDA